MDFHVKCQLVNIDYNTFILAFRNINIAEMIWGGI